MHHIASTLAADVCYNDYAPGGRGPNVRKGGVLIKGGAGVASRKHALAEGSTTPPAVLTPVTDDELDFLKKDEVFQTHLKNGYVKILNSKGSPERIAKDMPSDKSAPLTDVDFKAGGRAAGPEGMTVSTGPLVKS